MCSMHQVLLEGTETSLSCVGSWHCGDSDFAVRLTVSSRLLVQPRQRHDDHTYPAGTLRRRASCGWLNGDAVVQRLERPACTAQTSSHGEYSKCPPIAQLQAWRCLHYWSVPLSAAFCSTPTLTSVRCCLKLFTSALLSGTLTAPDYVVNCIEVMAVRWPEIWKFIRVSYIIALSDWRQQMMHRMSE